MAHFESMSAQNLRNGHPAAALVFGGRLSQSSSSPGLRSSLERPQPLFSIYAKPAPVDKQPKPQKKPKPVPPPPISVAKYLDNPLLSDVEFVVHPESHASRRTFKAHKQFLAMRNEVFGTMFFGSLPEKDTVLITDLHPDGFYGFLKYLYTGTCKPDTFEEAMYTRQAAEKYMVPEVVSACSAYIAEHISADKVCPLLDCLATFDLERVDMAAITLLKKDGLSVLNSGSFVDALDSTVKCILETIGWVPESCVVDGFFRWAEQKVRNSVNVGETGVTLEAVLRPFLPKFRFLALTAQEFVKGPASWGVIEESEGYAILKNIVVRNSAPLPEWVCTEDKPRS